MLAIKIIINILNLLKNLINLYSVYTYNIKYLLVENGNIFTQVKCYERGRYGNGRIVPNFATFSVLGSLIEVVQWTLLHATCCCTCAIWGAMNLAACFLLLHGVDACHIQLGKGMHCFCSWLTHYQFTSEISDHILLRLIASNSRPVIVYAFVGSTWTPNSKTGGVYIFFIISQSFALFSMANICFIYQLKYRQYI